MTKFFPCNNYILDGKKPIKCRNLLRWGWVMQHRNKHVGIRIVNGIRVSTVFLGLDHNWSGVNNGIPVLFETMIFFKNKSGEHQPRYSTWAEAEEGHYRTIGLCRNAEFIKEAFGDEVTPDVEKRTS